MSPLTGGSGGCIPKVIIDNSSAGCRHVGSDLARRKSIVLYFVKQNLASPANNILRIDTPTVITSYGTSKGPNRRVFTLYKWREAGGRLAVGLRFGNKKRDAASLSLANSMIS
jgi:hypothetical protein